jgi:peroxiredoxin
MVTLKVRDKAPDFELRNQHRETVSLEDLEGGKTALIFIPFAFTRVCEGELCQIRDELDLFAEAETRVVAITCDTGPTNRAWAEQNGFHFDILSDFWPHGAVSRAYDTFNETFGYAERTTYFLDENGVITDVIRSNELGEARSFEDYVTTLSGGS